MVFHSSSLRWGTTLAIALAFSRFDCSVAVALQTSVAEPTEKEQTVTQPEEKAAKRENKKRESKVSNAQDSSLTHARALSRAFRDAAAKALPSVVTVYTTSKQSQNSNPFSDIIGGAQDENVGSVGSGVIIRSDGLILTNHHVIADAKEIEVVLQDGRRFKAGNVKSDIRSDVAIIEIEADDELPVAEIGNSNELYVGDWVLAIGSPFRIVGSVSAGIISGTQRYQPLSPDVKGLFLQTDSAINPGNSGGPLVDLEGRVIGINTAISSRTGGFEGIGFAIPISRASWIKDELLKYGKVRRGFIGVSVAPVPYATAQSLKLQDNAGALARRVTPGRPGAIAGLKAGDVIVEFSGGRVEQHTAFSEMVLQSPIGEPIPIVVFRDGKRVELTVKLDERLE